jgi:hypothetical protein
VSVEEFQKWLDQRKADIKSAEQQGAAQRKQLEGGASASAPGGNDAAGQNPAEPGDVSDTQSETE